MITKNRKFLTVREMSTQTGLSEGTIRSLCAVGRIKAANISPSPKRYVWVVTPENLEAFLRGETSVVEPQEPKIQAPRIRRQRIDANVPKHF